MLKQVHSLSFPRRNIAQQNLVAAWFTSKIWDSNSRLVGVDVAGTTELGGDCLICFSPCDIISCLKKHKACTNSYVPEFSVTTSRRELEIFPLPRNSLRVGCTCLEEYLQ